MTAPAVIPVHEHDQDQGGLADWREEVRALARASDAVILAHNYQTPAIQDVADHVGDSLALSRIAAMRPSVVMLSGARGGLGGTSGGRATGVCQASAMLMDNLAK